MEFWKLENNRIVSLLQTFVLNIPSKIWYIIFYNTLILRHRKSSKYNLYYFMLMLIDFCEAKFIISYPVIFIAKQICSFYYTKKV